MYYPMLCTILLLLPIVSSRTTVSTPSTQNSGTSNSPTIIPVTPTGFFHSTIPVTQNSGTSHSTIPVTPTGFSPTVTRDSDIQLGSNVELSTVGTDLEIASESTDIELSTVGTDL